MMNTDELKNYKKEKKKYLRKRRLEKGMFAAGVIAWAALSLLN